MSTELHALRPAIRIAMIVALVACGTSAPTTSAPPPGATGNVSDPSDPSGPSAPSSSSSSSSSGSPSTPDGSKDDAGSPSSDGGFSLANVSCAMAPPAGATLAPPLPVYAGTCPPLAAPPAFTTLSSSGAKRDFLVFRPQTIASGEKLPVVFLWHWLGGDPDDVGSKLEVQTAVDARRFIGVVPKSKGDALFRWPFDTSQSQSRVDEEAKFFDDMLACVAAALPVDKECVSSAGVSAGALWTAQLAVARSERLASIASLSGGTGASVVRSWSTTPHRLPALVLWGGSGDTYPEQVPIMNFEKASNDMLGALTKDGHFAVECIHNCGHAVPPFDPPPPGGLLFDMLWRFVLDHPYWLAAGQSPYTAKPFPAGFPSWCAIGKGHATPRPANEACQ